MIIDLSKAKAYQKDILAPLSKGEELTLYKEAEERKITVSELLERHDPSPEGSEHDAFQRQFMAAGLAVSDPRRSPTVSQLFSSSISHLMPEFVRRAVLQGINDYWSDPNGLVAFETELIGNSAHPMYLSNKEVKGGSLKKRSDGAEMSTIDVLYQEKGIPLKQYGKVLNVEYRVLKDKTSNEFAQILQLIGLNLAADQIGDIYSVIKDGDGTTGAADITTSGASGAANMAYADFVNFFLAMDSPYTLNAMIMNVAQLTAFLNLAEIKDPLAFIEPFIRNGKIMTPFGIVIYRYNAGNSRYTPGCDAKRAIVKNIGQPLMVEAGKIIERKMDKVAISEDVVYSVSADPARQVLDFQS